MIVLKDELKRRYAELLRTTANIIDQSDSILIADSDSKNDTVNHVLHIKEEFFIKYRNIIHTIDLTKLDS